MDPTDRVVAIVNHDQFGLAMAVRLWRYVCSCGNIWANDLQRQHNNHEYSRAVKQANTNNRFG